MTRDDMIKYLDDELTKLAEGFPCDCARPAGGFIGNPPREAVMGIRLVAPDGTLFYLAVLEKADFEDAAQPRDAGRKGNGG